jgi:hypothetical protein
MDLDPEALRRLERTFLPDSSPSPQWHARLSGLFRELGVDGVDVIAYLQSMFLHENGSSRGNAEVAASVRAPLAKWKHFGSSVVPVVRTTSSERWIAHVADFYDQLGIEPVFAVGERTSDGTRDLLSSRGSRVVRVGEHARVDLVAADALAATGADWVLLLNDDELPTPALLHCVDSAVEQSAASVWGFPRVYCRHDASSDALQYSQFLPFGPFANASLQWRLFARHDGPTERRSSRTDAILLSFDWLLRPLAERVDRVAQGEVADGRTVPTLAHFSLPEAIPERWHMFTPLPNETYQELGRRLSRASSRDRESPPRDPAQLREEAISEASSHFAMSRVAEGVEALRRLRWATIDDSTLARTDVFLSQIAAGRRIVATFDPGRQPAKDEVVIVYGNYPHFYGNVVANNPIKRHVAAFGEFDYDLVEYDRRWDGVGQIYVINADDRADRYDAVMRELATARAPLHRVTRVSATMCRTTGVPHVDGALGCLSSHVDALRRAKAAGFAHTLVLEDDFCFTSDLDEHLDDLRAFLSRDYEYLVCLVATSKYGLVVPSDDLVARSLQPVTNAGGYLVSAAGLERLLPMQELALERLKETGDVATYAADRYWTRLQETGKFLVFRRKLGFQASSFSDIERQISRYLD